MKECISETDHYSRFPEKGYPLDEECDLVEIHGQEVAYCVCRSKGCNQNPIADQFMAFEEVRLWLLAIPNRSLEAPGAFWRFGREQLAGEDDCPPRNGVLAPSRRKQGIRCWPGYPTGYCSCQRSEGMLYEKRKILL